MIIDKSKCFVDKCHQKSNINSFFIKIIKKELILGKDYINIIQGYNGISPLFWKKPH